MEELFKIMLCKRKRFLTNAPIEYNIVQKQRRKMRRESLEVWLKYKDYKKFEDYMEPLKNNLNKKTLWYHRIQLVRRKLGLKTI
ncbi:hypothetical protein [Moheibacter sp.]|uniref:hypothetical protein n=1 Tax=Moheibacter sp. TaxID=1965316 RepID=UPI003C7870EB